MGVGRLRAQGREAIGPPLPSTSGTRAPLLTPGPAGCWGPGRAIEGCRPGFFSGLLSHAGAERRGREARGWWVLYPCGGLLARAAQWGPPGTPNGRPGLARATVHRRGAGGRRAFPAPRAHLAPGLQEANSRPISKFWCVGSPDGNGARLLLCPRTESAMFFKEEECPCVFTQHDGTQLLGAY